MSVSGFRRGIGAELRGAIIVAVWRLQFRRCVATLAGVLSLVVAPLIAVGVSAGPAGAVSDDAGFRALFTTAGTTTIDLDADFTLQCPALVRASSTDLTINGNGHRLTQNCAGTASLALTGTGGLTLNSVILDGNAHIGGPGVTTVDGDVTLNNSTITATSKFGIDVTTSADVTLANSTISGVGTGDGIDSFGGTIALTNSTITGSSGDGIASDAPTTLVDSTVSNNGGNGVDTNGQANSIVNSTVTGNQGTGVATAHTMTLVYATITNNNLAHSSGQNLHFNGSGTYVMFASVIAGVTPNCDPGSGTFTSHGFNFSDDATCHLTQSTDKPSGGSAGLGALANNGGPTMTLLPAPGSPLIDAIPLASCQSSDGVGITTDQRSLARPAGSGCDIGAVEVQPETPPTPAPSVATQPTFTG